jgi:hypothetical protein
VYKIYVPKKEIGEFVEQFGKYRDDKILNNVIIDLPKNLLESFLVGYHSVDGNIRYSTSSVSKELIYGIGQCIAKVYNIPYSIYKTDNVITRGNEDGQRNTYTITYDFTDSNKKQAFYENGYIWNSIISVENTMFMI